MTLKRLSSCLIVAGIGLVSAGAWAHHSESEFDFKQVVEVKGNVVNLDWRSPHARLSVAALDAQGKTVNWDFELPSPMTLMRRGWKRNSLKPGDQVTVKAAKARRFANIAYASAISDGAGNHLFTGVTRIYEPEAPSSSP